MSDNLHDDRKLYGERDPVEQDDYYIRHVHHMTTENLHSKSDIAMELAHRDIEIDRLSAKVSAAKKAYGSRFNSDSRALAFLDDARGYLMRSEPDAALVQIEMAMSELAAVSSAQEPDDE